MGQTGSTRTMNAADSVVHFMNFHPVMTTDRFLLQGNTGYGIGKRFVITTNEGAEIDVDVDWAFFERRIKFFYEEKEILYLEKKMLGNQYSVRVGERCGTLVEGHDRINIMDSESNPIGEMALGRNAFNIVESQGRTVMHGVLGAGGYTVDVNGNLSGNHVFRPLGMAAAVINYL